MNILSPSGFLVILFLGMGGWIAFAGYMAGREWRMERQREENA